MSIASAASCASSPRCRARRGERLASRPGPPDRVDARADLALVAVGQRAERALELSERRLPPENRDLCGLELLERGRGVERRPAARVFLVERAQQLGSVHGGRV
jgi:hypothetical protein